eukprot:5416865-Alexandrium_andersonii.AAC.1
MLDGVLTTHAHPSARRPPGSADTQRSLRRRQCGEWPLRLATEDGKRAWDEPPGSGSIGRGPPNPW